LHALHIPGLGQLQTFIYQPTLLAFRRLIRELILHQGLLLESLNPVVNCTASSVSVDCSAETCAHTFELSTSLRVL
jgi:hypothetical protein